MYTSVNLINIQINCMTKLNLYQKLRIPVISSMSSLYQGDL